MARVDNGRLGLERLIRGVLGEDERGNTGNIGLAVACTGRGWFRGVAVRDEDRLLSDGSWLLLVGGIVDSGCGP